VFVPGYWDYPLEDRGLLFAPVCIDRRVYLQPNFCFTPTCCLPCDCLCSALFVRPGCCCYFFGDFFGPRCERQGFCAWLDCRVGGHPCDPLWSHFAHHHHAGAGDLRRLYSGRHSGDIPPPPRTLAQQHTLLQNLRRETGTDPGKDLMVVAPLHQVDRQTVKLHALPHDQRVAEQQAARHLHEVAKQRNQVEGDLLAKAPPTPPTEAAHKVKVELPATAAPLKDRPIVAAPPPPTPAIPHEQPHVARAAPVPPSPPASAALKQEVVPPHDPKTEAPAEAKHDPTPPAPHKEPPPPPPPDHKDPAPPPPPKKEPAVAPLSPMPAPPPPKVNIAPPPPPKMHVAPPPPPPPVRAMPPPPAPRPAPPPPPPHHHK
jgi:hypothetical protein